MTLKFYDYLIIGAGIMGLTVARELRRRFPDVSIAVLEKESDVAAHASGRNSGVLHAGFYYTADSLKARFTRDGNRAMKLYCRERGLTVNECGKLVVAKDESELAGLEELKRRADHNGVELHWLDEEETAKIDPNARTYRNALFSPTTASVDPMAVCQALKEDNIRDGIDFYFNARYIKTRNNEVYTSAGIFACNYLINAAGLYADKIAHQFGYGKEYTIIPFKGIYLKYDKNKTDVGTNIYPVPNLGNPFLGVHYTKTVNGTIKIGPTAIPAFWRENYSGFKRFHLGELAQTLYHEGRLFLRNSFHFRDLAFQEMKKYIKSNFIGLSTYMVKSIDRQGFGDFLQPGIRAQLLNKRTLELLQDFVIEGDHRSLHVLNAVSPAFTCSIPFAEFVVDSVVAKRKIHASNGGGA